VAGRRLRPGDERGQARAVPLRQLRAEVGGDLLDVHVVPDVPLHRRGEQRVVGVRGIPAGTVRRQGPQHLGAVRDHGQVACLMMPVDDPLGGQVPDDPAVAHGQLFRPEKQDVGGHSPFVRAGDRRRHRRHVAVRRHVEVPFGGVDHRGRAAFDGLPVPDRAQCPELLIIRARVVQLRLRVRQALLELPLELGEQPVGGQRHEQRRVAADLDGHALAGQPAQRLVDLGLRDAGEVGQGVPGHGLPAEQADIGLRLVGGKAEVDQSPHRQRKMIVRRHANYLSRGEDRR